MSASSYKLIQLALIFLLPLAYPLSAQYPGPASGNPQDDTTGFPPTQDQLLSPRPDPNPFAELDRISDGFPQQSLQRFESAPADRGQSATVSVAELKHPLSKKARKLLIKAQTAFRAGKAADAIAELKRALKVPSAEPYVHSMLSTIYLLQGHVRQAIPELKLAAEQLPTAANYSNLGLAHCLSGDCKQGEAELQHALELDSSTPEPHYLIGLIHMDETPVGANACEDLEQAASTVPNAGMALAVCYVRTGQLSSARIEIRRVLGKVDDVELQQWTAWAKGVASEPRPSAAFGFMPVSSQAASE